MKRRWNSETPSASEEDAHRPIAELHHPLHQKMGVIKMLMDRCNNIVSEPEDRDKEVEHITKAQERCGYPSWPIKKMKEQKEKQQRKEG